MIVATLLALLALALGGQNPTPPETAKKRLLYLTHSAGYRHEVLPLSQEVVRRLGRTSGFDVTATEDVSLISEAGLRAYDAVFFYTSGELPITDAQKQALLAFVKGGRGSFGAHSATFYSWPEYGRMLRGYFDGHPWHTSVKVRVEARNHPATRHLPAVFEVRDEIYQFRDWSRDGLQVLLSLDPALVDLSAPGTSRKDRDFALAWTRRFGDGRVFYTALGHEPAVWDDARFTGHLARRHPLGNGRLAGHRQMTTLRAIRRAGDR